MTIRHKKKRVVLLTSPARGIPGLGTRPRTVASHPPRVDRSTGQKGRPGSVHASRSHSLEWEEERITSDRLHDALASTSAALDANRNYPSGRRSLVDPVAPGQKGLRPVGSGRRGQSPSRPWLRIANMR